MTTSEDARTESNSLTDPIPCAAAPGGASTAEEITLVLANRTVAFTAQLVDTILPFDGDLAVHPDCWPRVYLTGGGNVAIHDQFRRSLSVHSIEEFVSIYAGSPVHYIVDEVLDVVNDVSGRPVERLDI
jgi:hypothetical protein